MKVQLSNIVSLTSQRWLQDYSDRKTLLPGGITLDAAQFTADSNGEKIVLSGTVVSRASSEFKFGPAADADAEFYIVWRDINITLDGELAEVVRGGLLIEKFMPTITPAVRTILVDRGFQFLAYSTGSDE